MGLPGGGPRGRREPIHGGSRRGVHAAEGRANPLPAALGGLSVAKCGSRGTGATDSAQDTPTPPRRRLRRNNEGGPDRIRRAVTRHGRRVRSLQGRTCGVPADSDPVRPVFFSDVQRRPPESRRATAPRKRRSSAASRSGVPMSSQSPSKSSALTRPSRAAATQQRRELEDAVLATVEQRRVVQPDARERVALARLAFDHAPATQHEITPLVVLADSARARGVRGRPAQVARATARRGTSSRRRRSAP